MSKGAKDQCYLTLKQRVLSLELQPGQLLDETALSSDFGISRTPLREVVQRLAGEGYLVLLENRGAKVASMDFATMRHFFQAAPMIYAAVARLAAENARAVDIDRLTSVQRDYRTAIEFGTAAEMSMANYRFHERVGQIAASPYLMPALYRLMIDHTRIGQTFYQPRDEMERDKIRQSADQHDEMIEAFAANEPSRAVDITLRHWTLSRDQIEQFVRPDPLPIEYDEAEQHAI